MTDRNPHPRDLDARAQAVVDEWYLAQGEGEKLEVEELCGGDANLVERVRSLLARGPQEAGRMPVAGTLPPAPDGPLDFPHERLGAYRLLRRIGRGPGRSTFLAEEEPSGRLAAVKFLEHGALPDEAARARVHRDVEAAAAVDHPNLVAVWATGEVDEGAWVATHWLTGPSLASAPKPMAAQDVARTGVALASALEAAHRAGLVHGDVRPANVLLHEGRAQLVDLGLPPPARPPEAARPYLAPERLDPGARPAGAPARDPRADLYGLAATLYELLAGTPPPVASGTAGPPALRLARTDRGLEFLVLHAMDPSPEARIRTARELGDELRRFAAGEPIRVRPPSLTARAARLLVRHRRLVAAGVALVVLALLAALLRSTERARVSVLVDHEVARASKALDDARPRRALDILAPWIDGQGHLAGAEPVLDRARAGSALESLSLALLGPASLLDAPTVEAAARELEATSAAASAPLATHLTLALARWHLGDEESARAHLAEAERVPGSSRATAALEALLAGDEPGCPAPDDAPSSVDEHVLVARVQGLFCRSAEEQLAELSLATRLDPGHPRARFARAVTLSEAGREPAARELLAALCQEHPDDRVLRLHLAALHLDLGEPAEARRLLEQTPRDAWSAAEAGLWLRVLAREERWGAYDAEVEELLGRAGRAPWAPGAPVLRAHAEVVGLVRDDPAAALVLLERAVADGRDRLSVDLSRASRFVLELELASQPFPEDPVGALEPLRGEGHTLLEELHGPRARGLVSWKLGMLELWLANTGRGFELLRRAYELVDDEPGPYFDYASNVLGFSRSIPRMGLPEGTREYFLLEAWKCVEALRRRIEAGALALGRDERLMIEELCLGARRELNDWEGARELGSQLLEDLRVPREIEEVEAYLERLRANLALIYGEE